MRLLFSAFEKWTDAASRILSGLWILPGAYSTWSKKIIAQRGGDGRLVFDEKEIRRGDILDIQLDETATLHKVQRVPLKAKAKIDEILNLKVRELAPASGGGLVWARTGVRKDGKDLVVNQYIAKETELVALKEIAMQRGARVRTFGVEGIELTAPLFGRKRDYCGAIAFWWGSALFFGVLAVIVYAKTLDQQAAQLSENSLVWQERSHELLDSLVEQRTLLEKRTLDEEREKQLAAELSTDRNDLQVLAQLSTALSDASWVTDYSKDAGVLLVNILTQSDISDTINILENALPDHEVSMSSPVTYDRISRYSRATLEIKGLQ